MRFRQILFCLLIVLATTVCTPRQEEPSTNVHMVWNRHTPAAVIFYLNTGSGGMAQTLQLTIAYHTPKNDEKMLEILTDEEINVALLTEAQALLALNANPTWEIIADLGPTTPLAVLSRDADTWREQRVWVNFFGLAGRLHLAAWATTNKIDFNALTVYEAEPLSKPASNTSVQLMQLASLPLDQQTLAQTDMQTVATIPQRLLLLGRTEFIKRHPQGIRRLLKAWALSFQKFREQSTDPLPNLAELMHTDADYLRKLLVEYPLPSANAERQISPEVVQGLEKLAQAGKEHGLLRRSFNPRESIP